MGLVDQVRQAVVVGNSDGIGLALTRRLLADGWAVTGLSRSASDVEHERYVHRTVDVTAPEFRTVLAECLGALPRLDLSVYAAGIGSATDGTDLAGQTRTLEVNLIGAARTLELVIPRMIAARTGHVIGISSAADALISAESPGYSASKAGLTSYLLGLAATVRQHGVRVTTVRFGFVDTKMAQAPSRPFLISTDRAVEVLLRCVRTRPAVVSYPRRTAVAVRALRAVTRVGLRRSAAAAPASTAAPAAAPAVSRQDGEHGTGD